MDGEVHRQDENTFLKNLFGNTIKNMKKKKTKQIDNFTNIDPTKVNEVSKQRD